jgi:Cof subfamily protein (haloacid dehalogenase superfamily)
MQSSPEAIRLLVIDIDGTLLDPHKRLTPRTFAAVQAAQEAGVIVTLATARRYHNSRQLAEALGLKSTLIVYDGASLVSHPQRTIIHQHPLNARVAQQAVEIIVSHRVQPVVHHFTETTEESWAGQPDLDNPELLPYFEAAPQIRRWPISQLCLGQPDPLRVVVFASEEAITAMVPEIATLDCAWYTIKRGNYGCAELVIMHKECTKATGISNLARHLGIPMAQVMALGDNINDLEMLQAVGWGVAMGHAPAAVREAAHAVTASNLEDGAAQAIERYLLADDRVRYAASNSRKRATC